MTSNMSSVARDINMNGLKSPQNCISYDLIIDVIPLKKQREIIKMYETTKDRWLLEQKTGIDSLHIKRILHYKDKILQRRRRNPNKFNLDAVDIILLEWIKYNIKTVKDISTYKIYKQVDHLRDLLDMPRYYIRKETWLKIDSLIVDNLKTFNTKRNFKMNLYSVIKTCCEFIFTPQTYRRVLSTVDQNTFIRIKAGDKNSPDETVLSNDFIENSVDEILEQDLDSSDLILCEEQPVVEVHISDEDDGNNTEIETDSTDILNDGNMSISSFSLDESDESILTAPDLIRIEMPVIQGNMRDEGDGSKTKIKSNSRNKSNNESMKEDSLSLEESNSDLILNEKSFVRIDISDEDDESDTEIKVNSTDMLKDESMKENSLSLEESEECTSTSVDLFERSVVQRDIYEEDDGNSTKTKCGSRDNLNKKSVRNSSMSLEENEERILPDSNLILNEKPIVKDDGSNTEIISKSRDNLNDQTMNESYLSLEERDEERILKAPDLILIEKPIVQIDISDQDDVNNAEIKSESREKLNDESKKESSLFLQEDQKCISAPDLILIEKPIVEINISDEDDGNNTEIKNCSKDLTFLSPMELNLKITSSKSAKRNIESVDFEDSSTAPIRKKHKELNTFDNCVDISKCNNEWHSNDLALKTFNTPAENCEQNLKLNHKTTKDNVDPVNLEVLHPVHINKEAQALNSFNECLDISNKQNVEDWQSNALALDTFNTPIVDVTQDFENSEENFQVKTEELAEDENVKLTNFEVIYLPAIDEKDKELKNRNDNGSALHSNETKSAKEITEPVNFENFHSVPINKEAEKLPNFEQSKPKIIEFSSTVAEKQIDKNVNVKQHVSEFKLAHKAVYRTDSNSPTVIKEYANEIEKKKVESNKIVNAIKKIHHVNNTETQYDGNNIIDGQENSDEDNIEIVFEIKDDDDNAQIELLEIINEYSNKGSI